jgi:hypothetical protein
MVGRWLGGNGGSVYLIQSRNLLHGGGDAFWRNLRKEWINVIDEALLPSDLRTYFATHLHVRANGASDNRKRGGLNEKEGVYLVCHLRLGEIRDFAGAKLHPEKLNIIEREIGCWPQGKVSGAQERVEKGDGILLGAFFGCHGLVQWWRLLGFST